MIVHLVPKGFFLVIGLDPNCPEFALDKSATEDLDIRVPFIGVSLLLASQSWGNILPIMVSVL